MQSHDNASYCFVIKAQEIPALGFMQPESPRPCEVKWIDRGTDRQLRPTTVQLLLRTLHMPNASKSVRHLREVAGLKSIFATTDDRKVFARHFATARALEARNGAAIVTASFPSAAAAHEASAALLDFGVAQHAICIMQSVAELDQDSLNLPRGHGRLEVAGTTVTGGVLGMMVGIAFLTLPISGLAAAGGLLTASAMTIIPTVSGLIGATGSAIAKMVSDFDVDGHALAYFASQVRRGAVLVSIDTRSSLIRRSEIEHLLKVYDGKLLGNAGSDHGVQVWAMPESCVKTSPAAMATP